MKKPALPVALLAATLATACGSKSDANEASDIETTPAATSASIDFAGLSRFMIFESSICSTGNVSRQLQKRQAESAVLFRDTG